MKTQRHVWSDSCWMPNELNGPAHDLLTRYLSNTVQRTFKSGCLQNKLQEKRRCIWRFDRQARESQACDR